MYGATECPTCSRWQPSYRRRCKCGYEFEVSAKPTSRVSVLRACEIAAWLQIAAFAIGGAVLFFRYDHWWSLIVTPLAMLQTGLVVGLIDVIRDLKSPRSDPPHADTYGQSE